jgi:hypothetical protein
MGDLAAGGHTKLLEAAIVTWSHEPGGSAPVQRGMRFVSANGRSVGRVAAVLVAGNPAQAVALLLDHLPADPDYRHVELATVASVAGDRVYLTLGSEAIASLPRWGPPVEI